MKSRMFPLCTCLMVSNFVLAQYQDLSFKPIDFVQPKTKSMVRDDVKALNYLYSRTEVDTKRIAHSHAWYEHGVF